MQTSKFHIPSLDGLRAIAFAFVFIAHSGLGHLFPGGSFGVVIFFFLSGYLITTLLRREFSRTGSLDIQRFHWRRMSRIFPPLYSAIFLGIVLTGFGLLATDLSDLSLKALAAQILQVGNYWIIARGYEHQIDGSSVLWSLGVEVHFYLLFPLLYAALLKLNLSPRHQAMVFWALCLGVLLWRCALVGIWQVSEDRTYMGSDTRLDGLLFGCALGVYGNPALDPPGRWWSDRRRRWGMILGAIALLVVSLGVRDFAFRETLRYTLQSVALYPVFIAAIRAPHQRLIRWLNHPLLVRLGQMSYSLYLVHYILLVMVHKNLPHLPLPLRALLGLGLAIAIAHLMYEWIERPRTGRQRAPS